MYRKRTLYIECSVLSKVSGIRWGSSDIVSMEDLMRSRFRSQLQLLVIRSGERLYFLDFCFIEEVGMIILFKNAENFM